MTTIVITKDEIAADTQVTTESLTFNSIKVFKFHSEIFGCEILVGTAGDCKEGEVFLDWLRSGDDLEDMDDYEAVVCTGSDIYYFTGSKYPIMVLDNHFAIGTGAPYALAILDNNGGLKDAVQAAIKRDEYTGGMALSLTL